MDEKELQFYKIQREQCKDLETEIIINIPLYFPNNIQFNISTEFITIEMKNGLLAFNLSFLIRNTYTIFIQEYFQLFQNNYDDCLLKNLINMCKVLKNIKFIEINDDI